MDELVRVAGFDKTEMEIDEWGMFSCRWREGGSSAPPLEANNRRMAQTENIERRSARSTQIGGVDRTLGVVSCRLRLVQLVHPQRANVPTLFFEWESAIPFVPLMIAPYMSIDLFFVGAPFLCRPIANWRHFRSASRLRFWLAASVFCCFRSLCF